MKNKILLLAPLIGLTACSKDYENQDPLLARWYLYSKEEIVTESGTSRHRIDTLDDRESYIEFASAGTLLTVEGNGKFRVVEDSVLIAIDNGGNGTTLEFIPYKFKVLNETLTLESSQLQFGTHYVDRINYKRL